MANGADVGEPDEILKNRTLFAVCTGVLLSRTSAVRKDVPAVLGMPEITPLLARVKPVGNWPDARLHA
jgi:hypothetical protein